MTTHTNSKHQAKPHFVNRIDPDKYSRICPECAVRSGEPNHLGWIDIILCSMCVVTRVSKTKEKKRRGY